VRDVDRVEQGPEQDRDRKREREAECRDAEEPAAQHVELHLEPRQQQQEGEAQHREHLDRLVDVHPAEYRGADDDAEHDLQDDRRQADGWREAERERCGECDRRDDHQAREGDLHVTRCRTRAPLLQGPGGRG
jgi:hypothetical protein